MEVVMEERVGCRGPGGAPGSRLADSQTAAPLVWPSIPPDTHMHRFTYVHVPIIRNTVYVALHLGPYGFWDADKAYIWRKWHRIWHYIKL